MNKGQQEGNRITHLRRIRHVKQPPLVRIRFIGATGAARPERVRLPAGM